MPRDLVDQVERDDLASPVDGELDGLVGDGAAGERDGPLEVRLEFGHVLGFAAHDLGDGSFRDEQVVVGGDVFGHPPEGGFEFGLEFDAEVPVEHRPLVRGRAEQVQDLLLCRVELRALLHTPKPRRHQDRPRDPSFCQRCGA